MRGKSEKWVEGDFSQRCVKISHWHLGHFHKSVKAVSFRIGKKLKVLPNCGPHTKALQLNGPTDQIM